MHIHVHACVHACTKPQCAKSGQPHEPNLHFCPLELAFVLLGFLDTFLCLTSWHLMSNRFHCSEVAFLLQSLSGHLSFSDESFSDVKRLSLSRGCISIAISVCTFVCILVNLFLMSNHFHCSEVAFLLQFSSVHLSVCWWIFFWCQTAFIVWRLHFYRSLRPYICLCSGESFSDVKPLSLFRGCVSIAIFVRTFVCFLVNHFLMSNCFHCSD